MSNKRKKKSAAREHVNVEAGHSSSFWAEVKYHLPQWIIILVGLWFWLRPIIHLLNGYWASHTGMYDPLRGLGVLEAWKAGMWDGRWFAGFDYGYGYPFLSYYAPLFHWCTAAFTCVAETASRGVRLNLALWMLLGTIGIYAASLRFWSAVTDGRARAWYPGLFAALAWLMCPYPMVNTYVRAALPEFSSGQMLAWLLFACVGLLTRRGPMGRRDAVDSIVLFLALSFGVLLHNFVGLVNLGFACVMLPFCVALRFFVQGYGATTFSGLLARMGIWLLTLAMALVATMFFWLPAMLEAKYVSLEDQFVGYFHYGIHFVEWKNLVRLNYWEYGASLEGPDDQMPLHLGFVCLLAAASTVTAIGVSLFATTVRKRAMLGGLFLLLLATGAGLLLTMKHSEILWKHIYLLRCAQFPWRLLTLPSLGVALLVPAGLVALPNSISARRAGVSILFVHAAFLFAVSIESYARFNYRIDWDPVFDPENWPKAKYTTTELDEYRPKSRPIDRVPSLEPGTVVSAEGANILAVDHKHFIDFDFTVANATDMPSTAVVAVNYFPAWRVEVIEGPAGNLELEPTEKEGFLQVTNIAPGTSRIHLWFANTPLRARTKIVSLMAWIVALGGAVVFAARARRCSNRRLTRKAAER